MKKGQHQLAPSTERRAFTLIDVLVSISVIAVLIAILLPSISMVRESARKVICSSDMRQIGLGMNMYAEDNNDLLPPSVFLQANGARRAESIAPHRMDTARTRTDEFAPRDWMQWDGLGVLFYKSYVNAPSVYYCPSHKGSHQVDVYASAWNEENDDEIITNYQYRGIGPGGERYLYMIESSASLVTDSVRSLEDINHEEGFNVLAAGLSVNWFEDTDNLITQSIMSRTGDDEDIIEEVNRTWVLLDGDDTSSGS